MIEPTLRHTEDGGGPPLVLVHGHPFDRSMWTPQLTHFAVHRRVIAPDLRGYGQRGAEVVGDTTTMSRFATDIAELLDRLEVGPAVLVGLSMGGQIVMEFHRAFPERVAGLVLADTIAEAETEQGRAGRHAAADRLLREGLQSYAREVLPRMVAPYNIREQPEVAEHVLTMMRNTSPAGAAAALRGRADRPDYTDSLARAVVPTAIIVGADDDFTPVRAARRMRASIPGARLTIVDGAAHLPNLERPAQFNAALQALLDTIPTNAQPRRARGALQ